MKLRVSYSNLFYSNIMFIFLPFRSLPGSVEQKELISDADEPLATSPPLELRRPASGPLRSTIAVPHSLQSPQDRATGKYHHHHYDGLGKANLL